MLLVEFFGKPIDVDKELRKNRNDSVNNNELFWFIIDHDKLHKDYFHSLANKIYDAHKSKDLDKINLVKEFMPMVKKGCMEFYHKNKLSGHFEDNFSKDLMKELCEKLYDHYREDVVNDNEYTIAK
jgi:hypothetical protein